MPLMSLNVTKSFSTLFAMFSNTKLPNNSLKFGKNTKRIMTSQFKVTYVQKMIP